MVIRLVYGSVFPQSCRVAVSGPSSVPNVGGRAHGEQKIPKNGRVPCQEEKKRDEEKIYGRNDCH